MLVKASRPAEANHDCNACVRHRTRWICHLRRPEAARRDLRTVQVVWIRAYYTYGYGSDRGSNGTVRDCYGLQTLAESNHRIESRMLNRTPEVDSENAIAKKTSRFVGVRLLRCAWLG